MPLQSLHVYLSVYLYSPNLGGGSDVKANLVVLEQLFCGEISWKERVGSITSLYFSRLS